MADKKNAGDAPSPQPVKEKEGKKDKNKVTMDTLPEEALSKTASQIIAEEAERRANARKNRFKRRWPEIQVPAFRTKPWHPPGPPKRPSTVKLTLPELKLRRWVPPYLRRRRRRARLPRVPPEEITKELYECAKLKKAYHQFTQVDRNKMMLRGSLACNNKRYRGDLCGAQTACIAFVASALLSDKPAFELVRRDVDDVIDGGDKFYRQCMLALKCYKGKPELELKQLLRSFYFRDHKYTIDLKEAGRGTLAKHPDDASSQDLMALMEQRVGQTYSMILSVGDRHFFIWGSPPAEGSAVRTVCYIFDPHMNNDIGQPDKLRGGGAFLRYAGVTSFVLDFIANYGGLDATKRGCPVPQIVLTEIEVTFVLDFIANYGGLDATKRGCPVPQIVLTEIEVTFVLDFIANYGGLDATKRGCPVPQIVLTEIEVTFVLDFIANYGGLDATKRGCPVPQIVLTEIEVTFVLDFIANYGGLDATKRGCPVPQIVLTEIEVTFVLDFIANYGGLDATKRGCPVPQIVLTEIEVTFVLDFIANYGGLDATKRGCPVPQIVLTEIEVTFVLDFIANYGGLDATKRGCPVPQIVLTEIEVTFVLDFIANYGGLDATKRGCPVPQIVLTEIEVTFVLDFIANYGGLDATKRGCPVPQIVLTEIEVTFVLDFIANYGGLDATKRGCPVPQIVLTEIEVTFVLDFIANYGGLDATKRGCPVPQIVLTEIEVINKEPLQRVPRYSLDLKALTTHCESEWMSLHQNTLYERKHEGEYPLQSLSAVSLATSRTASRRKLREFYQKIPKEPVPTLPMQPEKGPVAPTTEQIMSHRGEDFFLHCPKGDSHAYGRDDMIPRPKSETVLHSVVDVANKNFHSQFRQLDAEKWILRGTRHMASHRYQTFKTYTAVPCCVGALGALRRLRARAWNEDTVDETLDLGYNVYRESLQPRGGPIRRLVLGEMADSFTIRDREYTHKEQGIAVWGKLLSTNPKVFDLCRGLDEFFKTSDAGILQVPGEFETAIWHEGGFYYLYVPWPADQFGTRVGLREGGKACLLCFARVSGLCDHFLASTRDLRRKPFSISSIGVRERPPMPEPVNQLKPVAPQRWVVRGSFHEGDARFPEEHRGKQATPTAIAAVAYAHVVPPDQWSQDDVNETLIRGDSLYETTMENLEKMGINLDVSGAGETAEGEEAEEVPAGTLAAADVATRFRITDYDCIETDVQDSVFSGSLSPAPGILSLRQSLKKFFQEASYGVVTARGSSLAVMRADNKLYMFDPHGCDENGYLSDDVRAAACLVCVGSSTDALADAIESNLPPGSDDSFNISPVDISPTKLNVELNAPEPKLESKAFEWIKKGASATMAGPRGENSAIGKSATRAGIGDEDKAGRTLALPAVAAFAAAAAAVPPPHMHQDHMFNLLDAGAEYYLQHVKKTGNKNIDVEDLTEKFEMGVNTFSIELGEPTRLPLRLPDEAAGEGAEAGEMPGEVDEGIKEIKDLLTKMWNDPSKPTQTALLLGDYHQLGVWLAAGGQLVAFDPAPTLPRLVLTEHRIQKGDEIRLQRIKDEMGGEGGGDDEEEAGAEGEQQPEPEPTPVPKDTTPVLMVFASPAEFIDKLAFQGPLDRRQCLAPYKLYPVTVTNELTSLLKDQRGPKAGDEETADEDTGPALVEPLGDDAKGTYMTDASRTIASVRGRVAQHENYFMEPARDNQDAAMSVVAIVVSHIEPYIYWKPALIDAIVKYGDRLYTMSLPNARRPPRVATNECSPEFHLTSFNVKTTLGEELTTGDMKAGDTGSVLNVRRGIAKFFESNKYGVICAKDYCVAIWKGADDKAVCMFDPHCVGPTGRSSPVGGAGLVVFADVDELADIFKENVDELKRPGNNKFTITSISVVWEFATIAAKAAPPAAVPDEGYEHKVLTAYVELARGRTILRGSRPADAHKFCRETILQSAASAIVGACMAHLRKPHLWTRHTLDQVITEGCKLFAASINSLGYEFRPGDDVLMPLQVLRRFLLGSNYVRYDLQELYSGRVEQIKPTGAVNLKSAIEYFFERNTHGIVWCCPYAAAVWRAPHGLYMLEPHSAGPMGLRTDGRDDGQVCVLTFTSAKLMAHAYLQNIPPDDRPSRIYHLYNMSVHVAPIKKLPAEPPLVRSSPNMRLLPATSKVGVDGLARRASEADRQHAPGRATCRAAQRAADAHDREQAKLKGRRNANGWLVLQDGSQFLSARHSIACRKFPHGSRGKQALACCVMAVAMSRVTPVCRWCSSTLDAVLLSGDQLHQDSCLHYRPAHGMLQMEQVLRKLYAPGNCVCRVVVFQPRQGGAVDSDLHEQLEAFFAEEKEGVLVAGDDGFAVALFRTPRGFYMFDAADRDRYGRAVAPPCIGHARACLSQYPTVQSLADKLGANIPPASEDENSFEQPEELKNTPSNDENQTEAGSGSGKDEPKVTFAGTSASFKIYGMAVTGLRRLNQHEK